jgi:2-(1,2-epoxy-1,2-dihydrophenyl)acetyl-CoA isomerase
MDGEEIMSTKSYKTIIYEKQGTRAKLTLNRPEQRNGITGVMMGELHEALVGAAADEELLVLVLTGAGRDFCPGADLKHYTSGDSSSEKPLGAAQFQIPVLLHEMNCVTVAAIKGACAGAGLGWAAACDLRFASRTAKFNTAFLDVAVAGDMGGPWSLPRIVGAGKARELYFLPGKFDAAEAERIGLVNRVFEDAAFDAGIAGILERLTDSAPLALAAMKGNFVAAERMTLAEFIPFETHRHSATGQTEDSREAFRAFVEKRRPHFQGK